MVPRDADNSGICQYRKESCLVICVMQLRPRRGWVDNIKMELQEMGCGYMDWIGLAQDRDSWRTLVNAVMNLPVP